MVSEVEVCEDKSEYSLDSKVVETREQRSISRRIWLILEFSYGKDDLVDSIKPEDVLFLRNGCDAECEIVAVLSELVTTVIRTNDDIGNVGRESDVLLGSNGDLAQVEPTQEDETKDQNYPGTELKKPESDGLEVAAVPVSDITDDTSTSNQTEDIPMQDVVSSEASQDASSTTVDQSQQPLTGMFDADASVGDVAIPSDSDDESNNRNINEGEDAARSSIDSTD
ncbi:hypothetical protein GQ600_23450 [Phytophthora cactorum]|nr:hypothetical protein GQ600_23450 [Phytophthora cactorum]